jgi:DNA polymerase I
MRIAPNAESAYRLMHDGILTLSEVEQNGICIDVEYCNQQQVLLTRRIERLKEQISQIPEVQAWRREKGTVFNPNSDKQLKEMLFERMGLVPVKMKKGDGKGSKDSSEDSLARASADIEALDPFRETVPLVDYLLKNRKFLKARDTYIANLIRETVDGLLHPIFNLHTVITYRSSSSNPNFQNIPTRDPDIKKIIRRAFRARPGHMFGGIDISGAEVRVSACYNKDPKLLQYINDPTTDMHRDVAIDSYMLDGPGDVTKDTRSMAKNKFTFPQFYGDFYGNCAKGLWESIDRYNLRTKKTDISLKEHLRLKGIATYEQFEMHIQNVEDIFWNQRFKVYTDWKRKWYREYERNGYFDLLTGFRCTGVMNRKDCINYPVQGAAFHVLLFSLIKLNAWMKKQKGMRSLLVGQIHDEIVGDFHKDEIDDILAKVYDIMCREVPSEWKWLQVVPMSVDASFSPPDSTWYDKKDYPIRKTLQ